MLQFIVLIITLIFIILIFMVKTPLNYLNKGISKYNEGDFNGAINNLNRAIKINSLNSTPFLYRGYSKYNLGNLQGAIEDYT